LALSHSFRENAGGSQDVEEEPGFRLLRWKKRHPPSREPQKAKPGPLEDFSTNSEGVDRHFLHVSGDRACEALAASSRPHRSRRFHGLGDAIFALRTRLPAVPKPSRCDFRREGVAACPSVDRHQQRPCLDRSDILTKGLVAGWGPPCSGQLDWETV